MMQVAREFRLVPVVLFAIICLFTLKVIGIVRDGGYTLSSSSPSAATSVAEQVTQEVPPNSPVPAGAKQSWAQEMFGYPDITGSVPDPKVEKFAARQKPGNPDAVDPPPRPDGTLVSLDPNRRAPSAERAILERLQGRRQEIEAQARELDIRDGLLKAAEKRLEARVAELKELEARMNGAMQAKESADTARFKGLVAMYENMKAKDAAKIFDRLELGILVQVTSQISPRRMSDILGQMAPDAAERLTVELANRAMSTDRIPSAAQLPKIDGKRSGG